MKQKEDKVSGENTGEVGRDQTVFKTLLVILKRT